MSYCIRPVLVGFFQGVEGGGHAQSGLTQPQGLSSPSVAFVGYRVSHRAGT
jgi:hypothetical protein